MRKCLRWVVGSGMLACSDYAIIGEEPVPEAAVPELGQGWDPIIDTALEEARWILDESAAHGMWFCAVERCHIIKIDASL